MKLTLSALLALAAMPVFADNTRQMAAHEHGVGALNIAIDGAKIAMEFRAPGADIVGFEYAAKSAKDRAAIKNAVAALADPHGLFRIPEAAGCAVTDAHAGLESEDAHQGHADGQKDHDDHDHDHDEHAEHEDHEDHEDHDEHHDEAGHTEFHAEYALKCDNPAAISEISFPYFEKFANARELDIQILSTKGAQAFEITRDKPVLDLRGKL